MLLNNEWIKNEIKEEIKEFLYTNENEHTTVQILWNTAKAVLRRKFIEIQAYLEGRNSSDKQPNPTSIRTGETTPTKVQQEKKEGHNQDQNKIK